MIDLFWNEGEDIDWGCNLYDVCKIIMWMLISKYVNEVPIEVLRDRNAT